MTNEPQIPLTKDEIEKLKSLEEADTGPSTSDKPLIQEVTDILSSCYSKGECKRYFKPTFVAIGPLNHPKKTSRDLRFERGEKWKQQMAKMFINFCGNAEEFYKNVKKKIKSLRSCYHIKEVQNWNDEELAWMFLVDGCALLHFIALDVTDEWEQFRVMTDLVGIEKVDFFLLENQLPYQLLELLIDSIDEAAIAELMDIKPKELFKKFINEFIYRSFLSLTAQEQPQYQVVHSQPHSSKELFKKFIKELMHRSFLSLSAQSHPQNQVDRPQPHSHNEQQHEIQVDHSEPHSHHEQPQQQQQDPPIKKKKQQQDPAHLLDMLRRTLMGVKSKGKERISKNDWWKTLLNREKSKPWLSIYNVKELKDKGIRFRAREKVDAITDIDFHDHFCMPTLTLSPIFLHNTTMPLLLNLMAYELCPDFKENCEITSHLSFLDSLIDNGEDVKELRDAKVLHHGLGSDEDVAKLFNKISGILVPNLVIDSKLKGIHAYCNNNKSYISGLRANAVAKLTHICIRSPWTFLVFLGALAGLIMTGMQTYFSFHENKLNY